MAAQSPFGNICMSYAWLEFLHKLLWKFAPTLPR
uniref:Uncharacterized protein n=1 Tax=Anguilla anguilla TaxID=7936 RepID=A0A0E9U925_ANGAN